MAYISKKNIRRWLENYQALQDGDQLPNPDGVVVNSGPKPTDGVSGRQLNKVMLDQALEDLRRELPLSYRCVKARWLQPIARRDALRMLDISPDIYYHRCGEAVDFIYDHVNGYLVPYKRLLAAIAGKR